MTRSFCRSLALLAVLPTLAFAQDSAESDAGADVEDAAPTAHLSQFAAGSGPSSADGNARDREFRLLDAERTPSQVNVLAFDRPADLGKRAYETVSLTCKLRLTSGGDGGAIAFLHTGEYSSAGPGPFLKSWVEPNLAKSFAVGLDVHNPHNEEPFSKWGNYQNLPQREVSLHFDGRELVKRVAPTEWRADLVEGASADAPAYVDCAITLKHVIGGAEVSVSLAGTPVFESYFIAHLHPYPSRLAFGAQTRANATTQFDVRDIDFTVATVAKARRAPHHVEVFNHVLTNNKKTWYESTVSLPPLEWAFGRVILTLDIHDAGPNWDEWDRNGEISIWVPDPNAEVDPEKPDAPRERKLGIVPFITSYRTPCHWKVDVTHFRPWLTGNVRFEARAGTHFYKNRGYMMSVGLDFHHGTPELEPFSVQPIWVGTAKYKSQENHFQDFFGDRLAKIHAETKAARLFVTTTGHSQIGEFTPSLRKVSFTPDASEEGGGASFQNMLWKTDVYLNPNRPQYGTWKYSRAGWAPGDVVWPWWMDLTSYLKPGKTARLRYESSTYQPAHLRPETKQKDLNAASHVVRSYLIQYRTPGERMAAPSLYIRNVQGKSHAAKAGMKEGDFLALYDGQALASIDDLRAAIAGAQKAGKETVKVVFYRGSERLEGDVGMGKLGVSLRAR